MNEHTTPCSELIDAIQDIATLKNCAANLDSEKNKHDTKIDYIITEINNIKTRLAVITFASGAVGAFIGSLLSKITAHDLIQLVCNLPK